MGKKTKNGSPKRRQTAQESQTAQKKAREFREQRATWLGLTLAGERAREKAKQDASDENILEALQASIPE